ncbi:DUF4124 domain-containing protein [Ramlibacter pallidus]|uniref:DUF4124 domain-containing protein n=1 Tax=Ramlibacter pallidus TaxID=2780087 RepID=A0ABR9S433_9BURK|nr:DUF4124 domain-containing protein [Ramlibacter pallidus]MBE7368288.1 DUF4124 domain-containing protein [Ramlibacter pallidus]
MKIARLALLAIACSVPLVAAAQWQWVDKQGRRVFSDQAPPPDIAPDRILKQPGQRGAVAPAAAPEATSTAAAAGTALPKPTGKDPALEQKRKQAEAEEAIKKKAEEEKVAAARLENCNRAKASKATYDSGERVARVNAKGEREFIDDATRAAESKHIASVIARECGPQPQ